MRRDDILGTWKSSVVVNVSAGTAQEYDRQTLVFYPAGTGVMKSRTLFGRTRNFTWEFSPGAYYGDELFYVYGLGGAGAIATAAIEPTGELGIVEYPPGASKGNLGMYRSRAIATIYVR